MTKLKAPFPYFGGKSKVADIVWERFGSVNNYIEPFCGSMAMLLHNEVPVASEIVNDLDGLLINFWRAIQNDPDAVAKLAQAPPSEIELTARHNWVVRNRERIYQLQEDPSYYDIEAAAYYVYCLSTMIGTRDIFESKVGSRVPKLNKNNGIHAASRANLVEVFHALSQRLLRVRITCGDWTRVLTKMPLKVNGNPTAIFLDPPYQEGEFDSGVYEHHAGVFDDVVQWCLDNGEDTELRIALCGYDSLDMPDSWETFEWETQGGLGNASKTENSRGRVNSKRERIWFSPHCINPIQESFLSQFISV